MADYTTITDAAIDPDSPGTQVLFEALRDNVIAVTEGATSAPNFQTAAFDTDVITVDKIADYTIQPSKWTW